MVNTVSLYSSAVRTVMKTAAAMKTEEVELEPGTVMSFWVPSIFSNNKPTVVLLHGFAGDGLLNWQFLVLPLSKKYNLYVPDFIFFGKSYTVKSDRTARFQADCLATGLKKLGVEEKVIVLGFSYGGMVGFQLAQYHSELVGSMVISGSVLALNESISKKSLKRIGLGCWPDALMPSTVEGVKALSGFSFYKNRLPMLPDFCYKHFLKVMFDNRKERVELLEALVVKDEDVTKHQFTQTIHLIWGEEDKIFNMEVANNLKERLGGKTELHVVKEAGHLVHLERPCIFNSCLKQVLNTLVMDNKHQTPTST